MGLRAKTGNNQDKTGGQRGPEQTNPCALYLC